MSLNWGLLFSQGRCKAIGIPWSEEEAHAAHVLKIPAEFVRRGCLTMEEYEAMSSEDASKIQKTQKIPLLHLKREQLVLLCGKHGITVTDEAPRASLIECLLNAGLPKSIPVSEVSK